ncbi:major facilitator superfamily domain-containing protein [Aspergillus unguis]
MATQRERFRFPNPIKSLRIIVEKDISLLLLVNAIIFAGYYDITAAMPSLFAEVYGYNDIHIGLCYLPLGCGCLVAAFVNGWVQDRNFARIAGQLGIQIHKNRHVDLTSFLIEKARLQVMFPVLLIGCAGIIAFGWVLQCGVHVSAPLVILFFCGMNVTMAFNTVSTLLVDFYPEKAAAATAANNLCRCLLGAGATAIINPMLSGMGKGWCFTCLGLVMLLGSTPLMAIVRWGPSWREERRLRSVESQK